jgi:two-component system cell cycle sensor histidine kinase/response regulator CckA
MSSELISVLLVEDNPGDARLLREAVKDAEGIRIHLTHDATLQKGLLRVGRERFDVIMLDLSLPDADGIETLLRMHAQAPTVPIVVLTGLDDEALAVRAVREGAQDYLVKGQVTSQLLVRAMRYATERKRAVDDLQRSEEYFRSLIENALDIITVLDDDGTIRYASPSMERVLGFSAGTLTGENMLTKLHPEDQCMLQQKLQFGRQNAGVAQSFEFRIRHSDGEWRVLEAIGKRFHATSPVNGFVLNSRDVTERNRAEETLRNVNETLREVNETLRAVIETSPLAIYSLDPSGNVKNWNPAAERILGYSAEEVLNRPLPNMYSENGYPLDLNASPGGELLPAYEGPCRRKDGLTAEVSVWNTPLTDASGSATGMLAIVADNTERKKLEEQFRQSQKMEAVGRLAGGVAHDFNNLLTVITGYCQMLLDRLEPSDPLSADMSQVLKAADRATTLTKQLLAFSRQQIVQPKVVDLNTLITDMDHILKRLVGEDIDLHFTPSPSPVKVKVDPGQLEQVVVNLVVNARDAMPRGGRLTIATRHASIGPDAERPHSDLNPGAYAVLSVTDSGSGMDARIKTHLFEPFFTTKEKGRGTGLGLSTSYGIVKQNQGEIVVDSEPGRGSLFRIYLPAVQDPVDAGRVQPAVRETPRGTETVLVVEDEDGVRKVLIEMLKHQGYNVLTANCGHSAVDLYRDFQEPIHLLITDVVMPKMSGRELADHLRHLRPGMRVLFVSGYTDSAIVHHGVLDPGTHFLQKPFTPDALAEKVRQVLQT